MDENLYDILFDSSNTDIENGQILMQTGMYYYSIVFYIQSIHKMLNLLYIHNLNENVELDKDYKYIITKLDVIPDYLKDKIRTIMQEYEAINEKSDKVTLKIMCENILKETEELNGYLKQILMGKSVSLNLD